MSILDRILGRNNNPGQLNGLIRVGGVSYNAQWNFTRTLDSVYANPTARRCIERIANDFQRPDWEVRLPGEDDPLDDHPALRLLRRPNSSLSGTQMQYHIARDMELSGASFWVKLRGREGTIGGGRSGGEISALRRLAPQRVTVIGDEDDELVGFVYQDRKGGRLPIVPEDLIYPHYPHPERACDRMAPALVAGLPAETDAAAMRFNYELLGNDSALPGYLSVEGLTADQFREWKTIWDSQAAAGKTRFLNGNNAKYVRVGMSNQELMYDKLREGSQEDICRAFGPPKVLIDPTDATFANMDIAKRSYIQSTVGPKWIGVSDDFTLAMFEEWPIEIEIGFDLAQIDELNEGIDALVERSVKLVEAKIVTRNEVRVDLGRDEMDGLDEITADAPAVNPFDNNPAPLETLPPAKALQLLVPASITGTKSLDMGFFHRRIGPYEKRAEKAMTKFFDRQGKAVAARLRAKKGKNFTKGADDWWDQDRWTDELGDVVKIMLVDTVDAYGAEIAGQLGIDWDSGVDGVDEYLSTRSVDIAGLVNGTTADDLRSVIADELAAGSSVDEVAGRIEGYFAERGPVRAAVVARTEVIGAANWAAIEGARQSGLVTAKTWLAASDAEPDCQALDGSQVGLNDSFGDVDQPPLHPNCRCTVTFVVKDDGA